MASPSVPCPSSSNSDDNSPGLTPAPDSSRHAFQPSGLCGLGYGLWVAWSHLRPFIPFLLITSMVVALVCLTQAVVYGGPFKDPLFFEKFDERWPRPRPDGGDPPTPAEALGTVPASLLMQVLVDVRRDNGTM